MSSSIPSHVTSVEMSVSFTPDGSMKPSSNSSQLSISTPTSMMSGSGMSGLLNSRNLDEKLVVATLATLNSGSASTLIKQDLKWIIQSRRRAEGKSEIEVEFKKPVKDELTSEEVVKRARRRELNRLAARRSREKGQRKKDKLVEEIRKLQSQNSELIHVLGNLSDERDSIIETLRQHMEECSERNATRYAAAGLSQNVLEKLGLSKNDQSPLYNEEEPSASPPRLYICTSSPVVTLLGQTHSPPLQQQANSLSHTFSSCPSSPVVLGLSGKPIIPQEKSHTSHSATVMCNPGSSNPPSPMLSPSSSSSLSTTKTTTSTPFVPPMIVPAASHYLSEESSSSETGERSLPPPLLHMKHRRRNSSHAFEQDYSQHNVTDSDPQAHKFMCPASPVTRPARVSLERSFSFPSSHSETRVAFTPGMRPTPTADSDGFDHLQPARKPVMSCKSEEQEAPLDLVVRNKTSGSNRDTHLSSSYQDARGPGRRRSVDDVIYSVNREPLNLSSTSATSLSYPNLSQDLSHNKSSSTYHYNEPYS